MVKEAVSNVEKQNWEKVAKALREAGKTDCYFYRRAIAIVETGRDPMRW